MKTISRKSQNILKTIFIPRQIFLTLLFLVFQVSTTVSAGNAIITKLDFTSISGDELQIQIGIIGTIVEPKVFHTDNPARIALDFPATENGLDKKVFPINTGVVSNVYVIESENRVRVVINLLASVPFETKMGANKIVVTVKNTQSVAPVVEQRDFSGTQDQGAHILGLIPKQSIKHLDFRRGSSGEGQLLISLTNPNTMINSSEVGGKVTLTFLNTELPRNLVKRMDVSDFATPVQTIEFQQFGSKTRVSISLATSKYEYSSFQSEGLLTVEFRPISLADQKDLERSKFPYTGERLSLNFQDIPVRSVLQLLADFTDLNIVASDSVAGSVTLRLNDVPWDQVLDVVMKSKRLSKRKTGNVILVAPSNEINRIEKEQLASRKIEEQLEPLRTEYIVVNYAKAKNFSNLINGVESIGSSDGCSVGFSGGGSGGGRRSRQTGGLDDQLTFLSSRGTVIVDVRTNTLIVRDTAKKLEEIRELLKLLDMPIRQVLIEARIVLATTDFAKEIGVRFGVTEGNSNKGNTVYGADASVDLPAAVGAGSGGALALTLMRAADYVLNLELSALQDEGRGEILANPRILTSDRCEAMIKEGNRIPFTSGDIQNRTVTLVEAVLELRVTPQITPNGSIIMDLSISDNTPGPTLGGNLQPSIRTQELTTSIHVDNGQTLVLGGIYKQKKNSATNKVPFFADLPGIGFLFKKQVNNNSREELLIFVTPKIIEDSLRIQ